MVKVIDSIMGSGKSSWAINYMKRLEDDNSIMYVTPYLKELDRIEQQTKPELNTFYFILITLNDCKKLWNITSNTMTKY